MTVISRYQPTTIEKVESASNASIDSAPRRMNQCSGAPATGHQNMISPMSLCSESYLLTRNDVSRSRSRSPIRNDSDNSRSEKPMSNKEKLLALTSLQTAAGYFKEDKTIESIIGEKFEVFKKQCDEKNVETKVWQTALIIAFIEQNFTDEKDTWEMIVEKARDWLGETEMILAASDCLME